MRRQTLIGDVQFTRSMIPHHSIAILMCEQAQLTDPQLVRLCGDIVKAQREEVDAPKPKLERL